MKRKMLVDAGHELIAQQKLSPFSIYFDRKYTPVLNLFAWLKYGSKWVFAEVHPDKIDYAQINNAQKVVFIFEESMLLLTQTHVPDIISVAPKKVMMKEIAFKLRAVILLLLLVESSLLSSCYY